LRKWHQSIAIVVVVTCTAAIVVAGVQLPGHSPGYSFTEYDSHGNDGSGQINGGVTMATYDGTGQQRMLVWDNNLDKYEIWTYPGMMWLGYWEVSGGPPWGYQVQDTGGQSTGGYGFATAN
jgi:hypothetical protein